MKPLLSCSSRLSIYDHCETRTVLFTGSNHLLVLTMCKSAKKNVTCIICKRNIPFENVGRKMI